MSVVYHLTPEQEKWLRREAARRGQSTDHFLSQLLDGYMGNSHLPQEFSERALGLHAGKWQVSEDFDDPLPDEIWAGDK